MDRIAVANGRALLVKYPYRKEETFWLLTPEEAAKRATFITEALSWVGTPFVDCSDIKGPKGAVDCAMMLTRSVVDTGLVPAFEPRPYSPQWLLHKDEEKALDWMKQLGAHEVLSPKPGDVAVWKFGRTFAHMGVLANTQEVVHAYKAAGMCLVSRMDESLLKYNGHGRDAAVPRLVKYFDLFGED